MDCLLYNLEAAISALPEHIQKNLSHPLFLIAWVDELELIEKVGERGAGRGRRSLKRAEPSLPYGL
jgi:hypothetical protein